MLTCRCSQSDASLSFAGLGDLFDGLDGSELAALPAVQQAALSAALLLSGDNDRQPGSRVVGVAVLGVLRALSRSGALLLAVDDVQWLDSGSRSVLVFALRRLVQEPVRLVTSFRTGTSGAVRQLRRASASRLHVRLVRSQGTTRVAPSARSVIADRKDFSRWGSPGLAAGLPPRDAAGVARAKGFAVAVRLK